MLMQSFTSSQDEAFLMPSLSKPEGTGLNAAG